MTIVWVDDVTELDAAHMNQLEQVTRKGQPDGYAPLGVDAKVPAVNLPAIPPPVLVDADIPASITRDSEMAAALLLKQDLAQKAQPNGYAPLGADSKVPAANLPPLAITDADIPASIARDAEVTAVLAGYQTRNEKGTPNGFADLDATGKVPAYELPPPNLNDADIPASITRDAEMTAAIAASSALKVDKDSVLGAATRIVANKLLAGDANNNFLIRADGMIAWGPGGAGATDLFLYRPGGGGALRLDGAGFRTTAILADQSITGYSGTAYSTSFGFQGGGKSAVLFGPLADTILYRDAAGVLRTDGTLDANALTINGVPVGTSGPVDITGKVDKDSVVVAATRVVANKLLAGDAQPAFRIMGDGKYQWGAGGATAPDTNLYRSAGATLKTDQDFKSAGSLTALDGNASFQVSISSLGIRFGQPADTNLYRSAADTLKTDDRFDVGGAFHALGTANFYGVQWFSGDTNLYRSAATVLKTDGVFVAQTSLMAGQSTANQVWVGNAKAGIDFGSASDTSLYRSSAGVLTTNGSINMQSLWLPDDTANAYKGVLFGSAQDTRLYRAAANNLKTDGQLNVGANLRVTGAAYINSQQTNEVSIQADGKLYFGVAADTSLYRSAASQLTTPAGMTVGTYLYINAGTAQQTLFSGGNLYFGSANDVRIYRDAVGAIGVNSKLIANGDYALASQVFVGQYGGGVGTAGINFGGDVSLGRAAAGVLQTDSSLNVLKAGGYANAIAIGVNPSGVGARTLEVGAADSGGAGFRMVRVAN